MWFRNLSCFRFSADTDLDAIGAALSSQALRDIGPMELANIGFVPPLGDDAPGVFTHRVGDAMLIAIAGQERLLPSDVVTRELMARVRAITEREGRKVGSRERKKLKDDVITALLPQAFVRQRRTFAYLTKDGWLVIDTSQRKVAEAIVSLIRSAVGSFPCTPLTCEESPRAMLTDWVIHGKLPEGIYFGDSIELRDPAEAGAVVRATHQDLESDEVREHLKSGKQVHRLELGFRDRFNFALDEYLGVRKLRFLDTVQDELGQKDADSRVAELDATFCIMVGELRAFFEWLTTTFGVTAAASLRLDGGTAAPEDRAPLPERAAPEQPASSGRGEHDELYAQAVTWITTAGNRPSISALQRVFKLGYNRAAALIEAMEAAGVVSATDKRGERKVIKAGAGDALGKALTESMRAQGHEVTVTVLAGGSAGNDLGKRIDDAARHGRVPAIYMPWIENGERGQSSNTMFAVLAGISTAGCALCHPLDPPDLRRCLLLLEAVPEFAPRIAEMRDVSEQWTALVDVWGTLVSTFEQEVPEWREQRWKKGASDTYEFMQEVLQS